MRLLGKILFSTIQLIYSFVFVIIGIAIRIIIILILICSIPPRHTCHDTAHIAARDDDKNNNY